MSNALASFIPLMADVLGASQSGLYERQRALVRAGVMKSEGRRGPGSGVQTTSESVAMLLISSLAADSLTPAIDLTLVMIKAPAAEGKCPLTGYSNFLDALASLMVMQGRNRKIQKLSLIRTQQCAEIHYKDGGRKISRFCLAEVVNSPVRVSASLEGSTFVRIADQVREIVEIRAASIVEE